MKRLWIWIILLLSILVACSPDSLIPPEPVMQDGVWTGNGEGRSGTILVRITVLGHRITDIVVVSQSESSFAQDAINMAIRSALGQGDSGKTAQRKNRVGDVHENGFHAASPAKERLDEGFISIPPVIASSTLSRKASGRRFFPFVTAFWGNLLDSLPRKG